MRRVCLLISTGLALAFVSCASSADTSSVRNSGEHEQEILAWRERRVGTLRAPYGWLSLVGLHWLQEGENRFGSGSGNAIILPPGSGAGYAGSLWLEDGQVRVKAADGSGLTTDGDNMPGPGGIPVGSDISLSPSMYAHPAKRKDTKPTTRQALNQCMGVSFSSL